MKHGIVLIALLVLAFGGCATTDPPVQTIFNQPCDIYEQVGATPENSVICSKISNPCAAQRLLAIAAKTPLIWGQEQYAELFEKWAGKVQSVIETGVTYEALQEIVLIEIAKLNREAGMALLMVSDGIFLFGGQQELIGDVDKRLLLMSLVDLRAQVSRMAVMAA